MGWREDQSRRQSLAQRLEAATADLPQQFRTALKPCYRKRFLLKNELLDIILNDSYAEGIASWTSNLMFAERFKGITRENAVTGAIFEHHPKDEEVIVNFEALWQEPQFQSAASDYQARNGDYASALFNFKESQGEIVLHSTLKGSQIIALTGTASPFDELCDRAGIAEHQRDRIFAQLVENNIYPGEAAYTTRQGAQSAIANTILKMKERIDSLKTINQP